MQYIFEEDRIDHAEPLEVSAPDKGLGFDNTPSARVLSIVELLCQRGPLTYKEISLALNLSRAATWRLVATLRDAGWVCVRQGGSLIHLDPRLDEVFAKASFADIEFTDVAVALSEVADVHPVHIDLFAPNRFGHLVLQETTRRLTVSAPITDTPDDLLLLAMHAAMTRPQFDRHVAQIQPSMESAPLRPAVGPNLRRQVQQFPGHVYGPSNWYVIVSVRGNMGTAAALMISPKSSVRRTDVLAEAFRAVKARLTGMVAQFGKATAE